MTLINIDHNEYGLESTKAMEISSMFKPMLDRMTALEVQYNEIQGRDIEPETMQMAHDLRLAYVKVRTGTAEIHAKLKKFYLQGGRFVDGWKNAQAMASQGMEESLRAIEDHFVNIEKEKVAALQLERAQALNEYTGYIPTELGEMDEGVWDNYFFGVKAAHEKRIKDEEEEEAQKVKEAKDKARKTALIRKQNHALRAQAKKDREEQEEKDRITKEILEKQQKEKDELQAKLDKQRRRERAIEDHFVNIEKEKEERIQEKMSQSDKPKMIALLQELTTEVNTYQFKAKKFKTTQGQLLETLNELERIIEAY